MTGEDAMAGAVSRRTFVGGAMAAAAAPTSSLAMAKDTHLKIADHARGLPAPELGEIRVLIPSGSDANVAPIAKSFRELTGIPVRLIQAPVRDVAATLLLNQMLATNEYDIALPATYDLPDLAKAGAIRSLDPFRAARDAYYQEDGLLYSEGDRIDGQVYGYQTDGDAYIMFYNRRFFEDRALSDAYTNRFGVPFAPPGDWETLDDQILFISGQNDGRKGALLPRATGYVEWEWWLRLHAKGIWPLSPDLRPQIAGEEGVSVLEDMLRVSPALREERGGLNALFLIWEDYERGHTYATMSWGGSQKFHMRPGGPLANDIVHTRIPGGRGADTPDTLPYFNWGWNYTVTNSSKDPELAHAFCLFAVSEEMSRQAVRQVDGFFDPFREEHYADPTIQSIYGKPFLKVHRVTMENAMPDFYVTERAAYFSSLANWIGIALNGNTSPGEAMARVADAWDAIGNSGDTALKRAQWQRLRAKYPREIAERLRDLGPA